MSRALVRLAGGERLILIGHEIAIVCLIDTVNGEGQWEVTGEAAYTADDWRAGCSASFVFAEDEVGPGLFRVDAFGEATGYAVPYREPRCPSERRRFERLAARAGIRARAS